MAKNIWRGKLASQEVKAAAITALKNAGEVILDDSNAIAPIDEGTLIRSGHVTVDEDMLVATISYDEPYAIRQHEQLNYKHTNGRKAKFLESAVKENAETVKRYLVEEIHKALR